MKRASALFLFSVLVSAPMACDLLLTGCNPASRGTGVSILSWNVQNLFDGVENGGEYPEFKPSTGAWNEALFHDRLELLSDAVLTLCPDRGPDILVLIEVENQNVTETMNRHYLRRCGYRYRYTSQNSEGIQTALLSRFKISDLRSHRLSLQPKEKHPALRDILSARVETPKGDFLVYINHWKSRLGGTEATEKYRLAAASLLNRLFAQRGELPAVACGDFNCNLNEFERHRGRLLTAMVPETLPLSALPPNRELGCPLQPLRIAASFPPAARTAAAEGTAAAAAAGEAAAGGGARAPAGAESAPPLLFSPWLLFPGKGSYFYKEQWETLDHFLLTEDFFDGLFPDFNRFEVINAPFLLTRSGSPKKWITRSRSGYSDHLPLLIVFS